jgi:hypothetical protein
MTGASIEATLELWASSLRDVKGGVRGLFQQERVATSANLACDLPRQTSVSRGSQRTPHMGPVTSSRPCVEPARATFPA